MMVQNIGLQFDVATQATLAQTRDLQIATAKAKHAAVTHTVPMPSTFKRTVDGVVGAPEEAVKPFGVIVYDYPRVDLVAEFALQVLRALSPVKTGNYRDAHAIYLNDASVPDLRSWKFGDKVMIANFEPYARIIEIGGMHMKVPGTDHVYQQAWQIVLSRYGTMVSVAFTFVGLIAGAVVQGQVANVSDNRWPALIMAPLPAPVR